MVEDIIHAEHKVETRLFGSDSKAKKLKWEKSFWEEQRAFEAQTPSEAQLDTSKSDPKNLSKQSNESEEYRRTNTKTAVLSIKSGEGQISQSTAEVLNLRSAPFKKGLNILPLNAFKLVPQESLNSQPKVDSIRVMHQDPSAYIQSKTTFWKEGMILADGKEISVWFGRLPKNRVSQVFAELKSLFNLAGLKIKKLVIRGQEYSPITQTIKTTGDS